MKIRLLVTLVAVAGLLLSGCAAMHRSDAIDTERILAAAGFKMKLADTPEKQAHVQQILPQRTLVPQTIDGQLRYVYADADYCKCIYAGSEEANQRFQKLSLENQISVRQLQAADATQDAAMNWNAWGGWGPWY